MEACKPQYPGIFLASEFPHILPPGFLFSALIIPYYRRVHSLFHYVFRVICPAPERDFDGDMESCIFIFAEKRGGTKLFH